MDAGCNAFTLAGASGKLEFREELDGLATIGVCSVHKLEVCRECSVDCKEQNAGQRAQARMMVAAFTAVSEIDEHHAPSSHVEAKYKPGTKVVLPDQSGSHLGDLRGEIKGTCLGDSEDLSTKVNCYIIGLQNGQMLSVPLDIVHEKWREVIEST